MHVMTNCSEYLLDDLLAITAIPTGDFNLGTLSWQLKPTIPSSSFGPTLTNAIVIGQQPAVSGGKLIPIKKQTGKAKDSEEDSTAGRLHTVSVSCTVDERDDSIWDNLYLLERKPCHLLLSFRDGRRAFVKATKDTYTCEVEREGAKTSVQFKIQNLMGVQLILS